MFKKELTILNQLKFRDRVDAGNALAERLTKSSLLADLVSCARATNAGPITLSASIDGKNLQQLDKYRVTSTPVNVTMVDNNIAGAKAGPTRGAFDGWWVFLNPLPAGTHEIHFKSSLGNPTVASTSPPFAMDVTYHLNVK